MDIIDTKILETRGWRKIVDEFPNGAQLVRYENTYVMRGHKFHLTLREDSNTVGRDWFVHVDNEDFETVGSLDVATFEQINELISLCVPENCD